MRTFTSDVRVASEAGWAGAGDAITRLLADSSCSTHVAGTGALPLRPTLFVRVAAGTRVTDALVHRSVLTVSIQTTVGNTDGWCYRCRNHNIFTLFSFTFKKLDRIYMNFKRVCISSVVKQQLNLNQEKILFDIIIQVHRNNVEI